MPVATPTESRLRKGEARGWIFFLREDLTAASRQILITTVEVGSPADGMPPPLRRPRQSDGPAVTGGCPPRFRLEGRRISSQQGHRRHRSEQGFADVGGSEGLYRTGIHEWGCRDKHEERKAMRSMRQCLKFTIIAAVLGLTSAIASQAAAKPLKVFILAGQSNMQGHVNVSTLDSMADDPKTAPILKEMRNIDGKPRVCERVWISSVGCAGDGWSDVIEQKGKLTTGFGASQSEIGPELTFGISMEKFNSETDKEAKKNPNLTQAARDAAYKKGMAETFTPNELKRLKGISNGGYHYLGAAKIMAPIGKAFAEAMAALIK